MHGTVRVTYPKLTQSNLHAKQSTLKIHDFSFFDNFGPGAALRVTRWCLALELAIDKQAARVASAGRVSGA